MSALSGDDRSTVTGIPEAAISKARKDLDEKGFCQIHDALSEAELEATRTRLVAQAKAEEDAGIAFRDGGLNQAIVDDAGHFKSSGFDPASGGVNQRVFMLVNKGECFRRLVVHELVDELVGHLLGGDFLLSTLSANIVRAGCVRMGLHTDQWWMPQPVSPGKQYLRASHITRKPAPEFVNADPQRGIAPPVTATAVWMLTDFSRDNGATELVPGSHLSGAYPSPERQDEYDRVHAEGPAGSLVVFDGRLWHGNSANVTGPDRIGILSTFCAPQFRQQENITLGLDPALWPGLSDKLKARLGYKVWNAYGRVEAEFGSYISPTPQRVGELAP